MKKLYIIMLLVITGIMAQAQTSVWDGSRKLWTRGEGTESDPFLIESAEHLAFLNYMVNKGFETQDLYFLLTTDIDLNGSEDQPWVPIGLGDRYYNEDGCERIPEVVFHVSNRFRGHFEGAGHKIYNLYIDGGNVSGLFGYVDSGCEIKNVNVESGYIRNAQYGGGIAGYSNTDAVISNCSSNIDISGFQVGGIVGYGGKVINCFNSGSIKGTNAAGGIAGLVPAEIHNCYNIGDVTSYGSGGGIVGSSQRIVTVMNCYNTGTVSGNAQYIGGICGFVVKGMVKNCYNVGSVANGQGSVGGVIGSSFNGTADNLYYLNTCGGEGIGTPKTDIEMRDEAFVVTLNLDTDVWGYDEGQINNGYPILTIIGYSIGEMTDDRMCLYPNPAKGHFTVEGNGKLTVSNLLGQKILEQTIQGPTHITLPEGIYLLRLTDGNVSVTKKAIVY